MELERSLIEIDYAIVGSIDFFYAMGLARIRSSTALACNRVMSFSRFSEDFSGMSKLPTSMKVRRHIPLTRKHTAWIATLVLVCFAVAPAAADDDIFF